MGSETVICRCRFPDARIPALSDPRGESPNSWLSARFRAGRIVELPRLRKRVPPHATVRRTYGIGASARSLLGIPVKSQDTIFVLIFVSARERRAWSAALVRELMLAAQVFARAVEKERTDTAIRESEAQFRGAFENSAIAHAVVSPDGRWVSVNLALSQLLGRTIEQLRETTSYELTHPDDLPAYREHVQRLLSGDTGSFDVEKRYLHKSGEVIHVREVASLVDRSADARPQLFAQILDQTQRRRDQAQIEELRRELIWFGRIATMGQLTAALAHELTQPLTVILSNAEALQRCMLDVSIGGNRAAAYIEDIIGGGVRAGEIINRVRTLLTRVPRSRTRLDLNRLLLDVSRVLRSDLVARGVHLTLRLQPGALWIEADSVEVQQIILNLLVNGADASVDAARRELIVTTHAGSEAVLEVCDFGKGVDPTSLPRLFEPFFTTKPHGMGMGLAICAELARAHGGRLDARNNADCGMTFRLTLPVAPRGTS